MLSGKKIVNIKKAKKVVFVGDTHGDLDVSQKIIKDYLKRENKIIFLGDYVDRGPFSKENLDFLLEQKKKHPNNVFLLQGNHEGYGIVKFLPADFWESLAEADRQKYFLFLRNLPLVAIVHKIVALHGALPEVEKIEDIKKIEIGNENWLRICWGDFYDKEGEFLGIDPFSGRPRFGRDYFFKIMNKLKKKILIRSHQLGAPPFIFKNKCLTIFTSSVYKVKRIIAIYDFKKPLRDVFDLEIVEI